MAPAAIPQPHDCSMIHTLGQHQDQLGVLFDQQRQSQSVLDQMKPRMAAVEKLAEKVDHAVCGNGDEGLRTTVARIDGRVGTIERRVEEIQGAALWLKRALIAEGLGIAAALLIAFALYLFSNSFPNGGITP